MSSFSSDRLVCVVLNHSKDALLLLNHQITPPDANLTVSSSSNGLSANDKDTYDGFKQYWFPFRPVAPPEQVLSTQRQIENLITELENEYCKNLRQAGNDPIDANKCESIQLIRIYSPHLLPINLGLFKTANSISKSVPKLFYYLCVLDEASKLNYLRERFDDHPNKIRNDNLNDGIRWMDYTQLKQAQVTYNLMGLEPLLFYKQYLGAASPPVNGTSAATGSDDTKTVTNSTTNSTTATPISPGTSSLVVSTSIETILFEPVLTYFPESQTEAVTSTEQLIVSAKFNRSIQEKLFSLYFEHTYPSETLSVNKFEVLFAKVTTALLEKTSQLNKMSVFNYFYAFDLSNRCLLTFNDFILGLAALEPFTQHGGSPAEQRCRYIFRFYSFNYQSIVSRFDTMPASSATLSMSFDQFKILVNDINILKRAPGFDAVGLENEALNGFKIFGLASKTDTLSLSEFLIGVGQLKFRGTSLLFRLSRSINDLLSALNLDNLNSVVLRRSVENGCSNGLDATNGGGGGGTYELATHTVKVKRSGIVADISTLWELEGATTPRLPDKKELMAMFEEISKPQFGRIQSIDVFNQKNQPNEMLNGLRYYERAVKDSTSGFPKEAFSWGKVDMQAMGRCLILICRSVREMFLREPRLLKISAPCYILGDIHGNYHDLVGFEKTLWRMSPLLTPSSFLFLGDYVDRGPEGIEVVSYLFAQKLLCPNKFFLLRGNHELRSIQRMYHFYDECKTKFGEELGEEIWEEVNMAFDAMPLAAVVDNKIFCLHGGIPSFNNMPEGSTCTIEDINKIKCPLKDPENECPMAWELLWNDPASSDHVIEEVPACMETDLGTDLMAAKNSNAMFTHNTRRGTGFLFTNQALLQFLTINKLSYVVRAHEVQQVGFKVQLGGRLLTVFSSSFYCGGSNEAATVLVDANKLRLIRIDTKS